MSEPLPREVIEAVVYSAKNWPRTVDARMLLDELNALATRVYRLNAPEWELARICGTCTYWNSDDSSAANHGYCANPNGWHRAKLMPGHEMCSKWENTR